MTFWLINPKNEGVNTDLNNESYDLVYMGWNANDCPKFYNDVRKEDVIIVTEGSHYNTKLHYIGIADFLEGNCWHLKYSTDTKNDEISKIIRNNPNEFGGGSSKNPWGPTKSIIQLFDNPAEKQIKQVLNEYFMEKQNSEFVSRLAITLQANYNLILTGAPGTGKTYLAKQIAEQMIFGEVKNHMTDEEKMQFDEQCGFVQFHPSYDYTDFVEGLRPKQDDYGNIGFERKDGIFKEFCLKALSSSAQHESNDIEKSFDESWQKMLDYVREGIAKGELIKIGIWEYGLSSADSLKYSSLDTPSKYTFTITKKNVYDAYRGLKARPSGYFQKYIVDVVKFMQDKFGLKPYKKSEDAKKEKENSPYVFIIDEINRGEISKIFGELFFSIDPGYRGVKGKVKTQYQNLVEEDDEYYDGFYVPENVYIIGTMNDIDRSVESMDFAFRRRFAFKEITAIDSQKMLDSDEAWGKDNNGVSRKPNKEELKRIKEKMDALNNLICPEKKNEASEEGIDGLSSAYHIGASYFLKLVNYKKDDGTYDYDQLWDNHLEGLLLEYMRGMTDVSEKIKTLAIAFGYSKMEKYE